MYSCVQYCSEPVLFILSPSTAERERELYRWVDYQGARIHFHDGRLSSGAAWAPFIVPLYLYLRSTSFLCVCVTVSRYTSGCERGHFIHKRLMKEK